MEMRIVSTDIPWIDEYLQLLTEVHLNNYASWEM